MTDNGKKALAIIGSLVVIGGIVTFFIVRKNKKKKKELEAENARNAQQQQQQQQQQQNNNSGGGSNSGGNSGGFSADRPTTKDEIKAFQAWVVANHPPLTGGADGVWGTNTENAWKAYKDEYKNVPRPSGFKKNDPLWLNQLATLGLSQPTVDVRFAIGYVNRINGTTPDAYFIQDSSQKGFIKVRTLVTKSPRYPNAISNVDFTNYTEGVTFGDVFDQVGTIKEVYVLSKFFQKTKWA
jgi:type II secretory pathway pseudopilin PulG